MLRVILPSDADRAARLGPLLHRAEDTPAEVEKSARRILDDVRARGDAAVREATEKFDKRTLGALEIGRDEWYREADRTDAELSRIITRAHDHIRRFHAAEAERVLATGFTLRDEHSVHGGKLLSLGLRPLARAGLYAPGGTARYPSTVLMTAVPAKCAGVGELVLVTPGPSPETLFAARLAGVDRVFGIGGAQAIGALAYGTESVPRVDKIVGPGNAYVAAAKRLVFGSVDIDQVAGPSEVLVVAEEGAADPVHVAADLLAQAEHDVDAYAVLVTPSEALARAVAAEVERQLATLPRRDIARASIERHGAAVVTGTLAEAREFANEFAAEHLHVQVKNMDPHAIAAEYPNAGAIFVGAMTPEPVGDYFAGPNHVLPTGGSARFSSPLGVHDFVKRTSVLWYSAARLADEGPDIIRFAESEGLEGHGRAIAARLGGKGAP